MLHPSQFKVDEAWVAFKLNDAPLLTEQEGAYNCIALMDAASCFLLANVFIDADEPEPSEEEARRLFREASAHNNTFPATVFLPKGRFQVYLRAEAEQHGISVVAVGEEQLLAIIGEARESFREHFRQRR